MPNGSEVRQGLDPEDYAEQQIAEVERLKSWQRTVAGLGALGIVIGILAVSAAALVFAAALPFVLIGAGLVIGAALFTYLFLVSLEPPRPRFCHGLLTESEGKEAWLQVGQAICVLCSADGSGECPKESVYDMYDLPLDATPAADSRVVRIRVRFPHDACRYRCDQPVVRFVSAG